MRKWLMILIALVPSTARPLGRVQFGFEFTFYDPKVGVMNNKNPAERIIPTGINVVQRMRDHLIVSQPRGAKFTESFDNLMRQSRGRFSSPNGWWFEWGYDDSVLEITGLPGSPDDFRRFKSDMQDAIFVSAANEGLYPALFLGGGHINLGMSAFDGNDLLLRNFIVDFLFNHNELFMGIFGYDTNNAGSIFVQTERVREELLDILADFDDGYYASPESGGRREFLSDIHAAMNLETDEAFEKWRTGGVRQCYFAVNFSHALENEKARIEFRAVRPQASMDVWVNQINLIERRLLYLEQFDRPIPIRPLVQVQRFDAERKKHHLNPPIQPQAALAAFHRFVSESGANWADHRSYVWPKWISEGELDRFERTRRIAPGQNRNSGNSRCEASLHRDGNRD